MSLTGQLTRARIQAWKTFKIKNMASANGVPESGHGKPLER